MLVKGATGDIGWVNNSSGNDLMPDSTINRVNVDLSLVKFSGNHLGAISQKVHQLPFIKISLNLLF